MKKCIVKVFSFISCKYYSYLRIAKCTTKYIVIFKGSVNKRKCSIPFVPNCYIQAFRRNMIKVFFFIYRGR